ncbi:MAG TPA: thiamine-phosphate kinase, partial [bacterium]|nr:thiamine-phosphate kinase [bacterium]
MILSERAFLGRLRRALPPPSKNSGLVLGPGDDAALWRPRPGCEAALSCDLLAEGVHFSLETTGPWELGARAAAVNLSDLAAMGAQPRLFLASLALPKRKDLGEAWLKAFHAGLHAWMGAFGAEPAGGDLSGSRNDLFIDVTVLGEVELGQALRRSAARPGDAVFVSGPLGGSAAGLALLLRPALERRVGPGAAVLLKRRHLLPMPRVLAGRWLLQEKAARACIDISDGLASEAWHLSRESGVALSLDLDALPLAPGVEALARLLRRDPLDFALNGGEDYELLFTVPR